MTKRCKNCNVRLTREEAHYYGDRCEHCERDWHERIQAWLAGATDPVLDAMFSGCKPSVH